jgi:hypothetical protein
MCYRKSWDMCYHKSWDMCNCSVNHGIWATDYCGNMICATFNCVLYFCGNVYMYLIENTFVFAEKLINFYYITRPLWTDIFMHAIRPKMYTTACLKYRSIGNYVIGTTFACKECSFLLFCRKQSHACRVHSWNRNLCGHNHQKQTYMC